MTVRTRSNDPPSIPTHTLTIPPPDRARSEP